jgi:hypothetical protein
MKISFKGWLIDYTEHTGFVNHYSQSGRPRYEVNFVEEKTGAHLCYKREGVMSQQMREYLYNLAHKEVIEAKELTLDFDEVKK